MASFPTYAKIMRDGYAEQRASALLRTEMESGPPKQAKIKSRVMVTRPVAILLDTQADYASFLTWYATTINEGADWFDYSDPITGTTLTARFVGGGFTAQPLAAATGPWRLQAQLESWGT
jgi:hypothetical protein